MFLRYPLFFFDRDQLQTLCELVLIQIYTKNTRKTELALCFLYFAINFLEVLDHLPAYLMRKFHCLANDDFESYLFLHSPEQ